MNFDLPLGKKESAHLEFKGKDSLQNLSTIGREVVAMLNAEGGEIWVGIGEQDGRAVQIQAIKHPEEAQITLRDHLIDTIEPSPTHHEVSTEILGNDSLQSVLRVQIRPGSERKPYCQLKTGGRYFYLRVNDRIRAMSREEIRDEFVKTSGNQDSRDKFLSERTSQISKEHERLQKSEQELFWLCILPAAKLEIDIQDKSLWNYLREPALTGNREHGWNFTNPYREPKLKQGKLVFGRKDWITEIHADGGIFFESPLQSLYWDTLRSSAKDKKEVYPLALLELPVSIFRLASTIYNGLPKPDLDAVWADLAILKLAGWTLRPYSPNVAGYLLHQMEHAAYPFKEPKDFLLPSPLNLKWREIIDEPDYCAFRLLRCVYEAYGYGEDKIPQEFDRKSHRLLLS